ncbi:MAG: response regulator [Candidatus Bathyarchaeota archaeon]
MTVMNHSSKKFPTRVLLVDNDAGFLKAAKSCLKMYGAFLIDIALSAEEATKKMEEKTFDVVICDYLMPEKNGLEFLKDLRAEGNNVPFIIFSVVGKEEIGLEALSLLDSDRYFSKNGDPETVFSELTQKVQHILQDREAKEHSAKGSRL